MTKTLIAAVAAVLCVMSVPSFAAPSAAVAASAPKAKSAVDRRTQHYARRASCQKQAATQKLTGDALKNFMYTCEVQK